MQKHCKNKYLWLIYAACLWLCCCATRPLAVLGENAAYDEKNAIIYVLSRGRHTGIIIAADVIYRRLPELKQQFGSAAYLEFGWGDRSYYQAKKVTTGVALKAVFLPTDSAVQVIAMEDDFLTLFAAADILSLAITDSELEALVRFVNDSFDRDKNGKIIILEGSGDKDSRFYQATGKYHLFNTCNKWTAKGLRSAGIESSIIFKITAGSVMKEVKKHQQHVPQPVSQF